MKRFVFVSLKHFISILISVIYNFNNHFYVYENLGISSIKMNNACIVYSIDTSIGFFKSNYTMLCKITTKNNSLEVLSPIVVVCMAANLNNSCYDYNEYICGCLHIQKCLLGSSLQVDQFWCFYQKLNNTFGMPLVLLRVEGDYY